MARFIFSLFLYFLSKMMVNLSDSEEKEFWGEDKSWFRRHWIITIILVLFVLGIIGSLFTYNEPANITGNAINVPEKESGPENYLHTEEVKNSNLISEHPIDLLPMREEIDTEWENIKREERIINDSGFNSGASLNMDRIESVSMTSAYVLILKFNSKDYAASYYSNSVSEVKEGGGYTEIPTSGIDATCFGYKNGDLYEGYYYTFYCQEKNIFFLTEVGTFSVLRSGNSKELAKIVADKL